MDPLLFTQLRRFLSTGLVAVSVDALAYAGLVRFGVATAVAKSCSFMMGTIIAYFLNKNFTFQARDQPWTTILPFFALYSTTLIANTAVNALVLKLFYGEHKIIAFGAATLTSTVLNFLGQRLWVFRLVRPAGSPPPSGQATPSLLSAIYGLTPAFIAFAVFCLVLPVLFPTMLRTNQMWAEASTGYFFIAHEGSLLSNLTALDYGYLPYAARLAAFIVEAVRVPVASVPAAYKWITLLAIALCNSFFALPMFRYLVRSDLARVMICLGLLLHPDYALKGFINFPYHLMIPYFLLLVWSFEQATLTALQAGLLAGFFALCGLSKPSFLAFAPALAWLFLRALRRRSWRHVAVAVSAGLAICIELLVMVLHMGWAVGQAHPVQPLRTGFTLFERYLVAIIQNALVGRVDFTSWFCWIALCGALVGVGALVRTARKREERLALRSLLLVGGTAIAIGILLVTVTSRDMLSTGDVDPKGWLHVRWFYLPTVLTYFLFAVGVARIDARRRFAIPALASFLYATFPFGGVDRPEDLGWPTTGFENWQGFAPHVLTQRPARGCIPVNPYAWYVGFNCTMLTPVPDFELARSQKLVPLPPQGLLAPEQAASWSVDSIGVLLGSARPPDPMSLTAYDQQGHVLGVAQPVERRDQPYSFFSFATPVTGVARVALSAPQGPPPAIVYLPTEPAKPVWIWFGRVAAQSK